MPAITEKTNVTALPVTDTNAPALDTTAIEAARSGAQTDSDTAWRAGIVKLLNDALATELVCILRYKRHYFTAHGMASPAIAEEFLVHATEETQHGDKLAKRIVQLGGEPDFCPDTLTQRSHASYDDSSSLKDMIQSNLQAERVAIEAYSQLIRLVGDRDPTTRRLLEDILAQEQEHAEELRDWLDE